MNTEKKIEALFKEAKNRGLRPMWTHYYRGVCEKVMGATSCCLVNEAGEVVSRGISVVSLKDAPIKATGRLMSLDRALRILDLDETAYSFIMLKDKKGKPNKHYIPLKGVRDLAPAGQRTVPKAERNPILTRVEAYRLETRRIRETETAVA